MALIHTLVYNSMLTYAWAALYSAGYIQVQKRKNKNKQNNNNKKPSIPQAPKSTPDIHKIPINELSLYYKRISGD